MTYSFLFQYTLHNIIKTIIETVFKFNKLINRRAKAITKIPFVQVLSRQKLHALKVESNLQFY